MKNHFGNRGNIPERRVLRVLISVFLAAVLLLSFAACGGKSGKDGNGITDGPEIRNVHKEFKDKNGRICIAVDINYPELDEESSFAGTGEINRYFEDFIASELKEAELNIENASKDMDRFHLTTPKTVNITFETVYIGKKYISFIKNRQVALNDAPQSDGGYTGYVFDTETGSRINSSFIFTDFEAQREDVLRQIIAYSDTNYNPSVTKISDATAEILNEFFDPENFILTDKGVEFIYNRFTISEGSRTGAYRCPVKIGSFGNGEI